MICDRISSTVCNHFMTAQLSDYVSCFSDARFLQRKILYFMNKDRRCITSEGQSNGQAHITLHYNDPEIQHIINDNCCTKFINCLKGSAKYRTMKVLELHALLSSIVIHRAFLKRN